jgi:AraC family transcriptional regulator of adaptative response/methylated-DNA-[protein]-cysteine methyltransferase
MPRMDVSPPPSKGNEMLIDEETAWNAVMRRDRSFDGKFVTGVHSTGIYCRPSCAARHPARRNVRFYRDGTAARAAGLRACRRCAPDDRSREETALAEALRLLEGDEPPRLEQLARAVGYAPHHFQRLFRAATGLTPAAWSRARRAERAAVALSATARITDAIYDAGYSGPSRFFAEAGARLGMTPRAWRNGGRGATIRWAVFDTTLGTILVAATGKGICRLAFDEGEAELRRRFPKATILPADAQTQAWIAGAVAAVENPQRDHDLPLDVQGTAFQQAVWAELRRIPPGETRTYAEIASAVGRPKAVRAAGQANGQNRVAILIPCHRVVRGDGALGGYAYGSERKAALLARERKL